MKTRIKKIALIITVLVMTLNLTLAKNYYTTKDGSYTSSSTWLNKNRPSTWISANDTVFIKHRIAMNNNIGIGKAVIIIEENGTLASSTKSLSLNHTYSRVINYNRLVVKHLRIWGGSVINKKDIITKGNFIASGSSTSFDNMGSISIKHNLNVSSGTYTNTGSIETANNFIQNGTLTNNGTITANNDFINNWSGNFTNNGTVTALDNLTNRKTFINNGSIEVHNNLTNYYSTSFTNNNSINISNDLINYKNFTNSSTGAIDLKGELVNSWSSTINNNGYFIIKDMISNKGTVNNSDSLIIYSTFKNENSSSKMNNTGKIIFEKDENGYGSMIDNGSYTEIGEVEIDLFLKGGQWHYISSPISNGTTNTFWGAAVYSYNESTGKWDAHGANEKLDPMKGYDVYYKEDKTVTFKGKLNSGTFQNSNLTTSNDSFHLIGNPYMSSIDWVDNSWTKSNVENAIYVWDPEAQNITSYVNGSGINGGTRYLAPMQAFFVKVDANTGSKGTLEISKDAQVDNKTVKFRSNEKTPDVLRLKVNSSNGYSDETIIKFNGQASIDFDANHDARKLYSFNEQVSQIYTKSTDAKELSINTLPKFNDMISSPLYMKTGVSGSHSIEANLEDFPQCLNVFIEDLKENKVHDLLSAPYEFEADVNDHKGRFLIHFSLPKQISNTGSGNVTSVESNVNTNEDLNIFSRNKTVFLKLNSTENTNGNITVYDLSGQQIATSSFNHKDINKIDLNSTTGYYIVSVHLDNGSNFSQKVFIN